jgi:hypothetical protein
MKVGLFRESQRDLEGHLSEAFFQLRIFRLKKGPKSAQVRTLDKCDRGPRTANVNIS